MPPQESADKSPAAARAHPDDQKPDEVPPTLLLVPPSDLPAPTQTLSVESARPPSPPPPADPVMDFDDLLPHVGEFGLYQKILFVLLAPFACSVAFVYFAQIFITLTPERHWCRVPQLESSNLTLEQRLELTIPRMTDGSFDRCRMYAIDDYDQLLVEGIPVSRGESPHATVPCRFGWEFDMDEVPYKSIAAELEWVCEEGALPSVAQAVFFGGAIVGGLVFGWMADRFGRLPALVGTNLVGCTAGVATYFVSTFWQFCVCRFLVGLAFDNCFTMMYILALEYVGPRWRTFVANMSIAFYFTLASCLLPWIALWVADWRNLCLITSAPLILVVLAPAIVPESARWLVSQGRVDEAITILKKFEVVNGKKVDPKIYEEFADCVKKLQQEDDGPETYSVLDLFKTPRLRRITILLIVIWMAVSLCFDGHVRSVGSLGLDVFVTFTVACATELPADTLLTLVLDRWGRRWLACGSLVISGIFSLLASCVPIGIPSAALAIAGRFSVNISYNIGLQYAAELLPTVVRAQGVALVHIMGYVATVLSPFIVYLGNINTALPLVLLGLLGIFGGLLSLLLPETLHEELPLTLQDGEQFGKGQRILDSPCWGRHGAADERSTKGDAEGGESRPQPFQRGFARASMRASIRGETYRSSKIQTHRSSVIRRSFRQAAPLEGAAAEGQKGNCSSETGSKGLTP